MPWFKFHAADWMSDPSLRMCSLAARGAWIDLLAIMHGSNANRGYLRLPNGAPMQPVHIARIVGCTTDEADAIVRELEEAAVFSRTEDGCIYSRRMVRDEAEYQTFAAYGAKGGNPSVVKGKRGGLTPPLTPLANPPLKAPLNPDSDSDTDRDTDKTKDIAKPPKAADAAKVGDGKVKQLSAQEAKAYPIPMHWPPEVRDAFVSFIECRYAAGKRCTPKAMDELIKVVEKMPPALRLASVSQSIANGYQGIFQVKSTGKANDVRGTRRNEVVGEADERIEIPIYRADASGRVSRQAP